MREYDICPCCHNEKVNTKWYFNFKEKIKVCEDCYNAMRISERDFFIDKNSSANEIFRMLDYIEATRYLK